MRKPAKADLADLHGCVLHIEDEPTGLLLVETILATYPGIERLQAHNGSDGIRIAKERKPDLILLDMNLPDIGGLEVVRALNEFLHSEPVRLVLLTAEDFSVEVVKAMSLGAHDYWRKPLHVELFRASLVKMLQRP